VKRVIPTSEGRLIEIEEGVLRIPPPEPKKPYKPRRDRPRLKVRPKIVKNPNPCPWEGLRKSQSLRVSLKTTKIMGMMDGITKAEAIRLNELGRRMAERDLENIKKNYSLEDSAAEEALKGALEVIRQPTSQQNKLAAARLVLEFTRSKPVAKSEVTVNKAEEWLNSLESEDPTDTEAST
jgi:hypothetical protein